MSQSAENQSAIIENENNFNIVMESQAAEAELSSAEGVNLENTAGTGPGTPTQDEVEESMDTEEVAGRVEGDKGFAADDVADKDFMAGDTYQMTESMQSFASPPEDSLTESRDAVEIGYKSPCLTTENQNQEDADGMMEVDETQVDGGEGELMERAENEAGNGNIHSEPEFTDYAPEDNVLQDIAEDDALSEHAEAFDALAEPTYYEAEAESESIIESNTFLELEGDQQIATDSIDTEETDVQHTETPDENLAVAESEEAQHVESEIADEDQNLAMEEGGGLQVAGEILDEDRNLAMEEIGQPDETEQVEQAENEIPNENQNQNFSFEGREQDQQTEREIDEDQNLPIEETGEVQQAENEIKGEYDNLAMEATEQVRQIENEMQDESQNQNLPLEETGSVWHLENEVLDEYQNLAVEETEQGQQVDTSEKDQHLVDENIQGKLQAEPESEILDSENQLVNDAEEFAEYQPEPAEGHSAVTEDAENKLGTPVTEGGDAVAFGNDADNDRNTTEFGKDASAVTEGVKDKTERVSDAPGISGNMSAIEESAGDVEMAMQDSTAPEGEEESLKSAAGMTDVNEHKLEDGSATIGVDESATVGVEQGQESKQGEFVESVEAAGEHQENEKTSQLNVENSEVKLSSDAEKSDEDPERTADPEADIASDATIEEGRDADDEPMLQVSDIKSGVDAEGNLDEKDDSVGGVTTDSANSISKDTSETVDTAAGRENGKVRETDSTGKQTSGNAEGKVDSKIKVGIQSTKNTPVDDDVVVLDDEEVRHSQLKKEALEKEVLNSNNDMGIQIESVSGGANDVHGDNENNSVKQKNLEQRPVQSAAALKTDPKTNTPPAKKSSRNQTCIVCKKMGKCKYNIVRNGDIKHLCDDTCFKRFRSNPTTFLKGAGAASSTPPTTEKKSAAPVKSAAGSSVPGYKTCTVCLVMNINSQGQFCIWKGLDFCGEGCLGKFQSGISSSCALCSAFIPLAARSTHCLRIGNQIRPFCSGGCYADYKRSLRLCTHCQKDAASAPDSFFSAPVGSDGLFKDFCSQTCMKKFEELLNTDVEIIRVDAGKARSVSKCSVCQKKEIIKHVIKYSGTIHSLCNDPCLSAFQYANKLDMKTCDFCSSPCTSRESSLHTVQFEGHQKRFCSDTCVTKFRFNNRKVSPCSWCGTQRDNFDMIERLDSASKYQLFCSLNCLSLYRVNLQAKSNQAVTCDQCSKNAPAQYHLTMSDASVRNFCSYNCVMTFQAQFSKGAPPPPPAASAPQPPAPKHKHNTRGRAGRGRQQASTGSSSFPIISNVISLAPQGGQPNLKNSPGMSAMVSGAGQTKTTGAGSQAPVQQQIIIQPPPPKPVRNKSILCKPFVQTKATSCRPHTQNKECQTDEVKQKPVMVPVPVPVYLPAPMALYSAPAPTPVFVPIPIPVPIFIPTTRKSANGILKQIKEIREKTPSDPLEAELLMMAAAVSADGKNSSNSDTDEEMLPEIRSRKRSLPADDDDDADVMPLSSSKEEVGGEEDMISMALRMAEEMSGPITDLESAVEAVPVNTEPPPQPPRSVTPDAIPHEEELLRNRRGGKRGGTARRGGAGRPPKRPRIQVPQPEPIPVRQEPPAPPPPPADANYHLKFTYGVNAWRHWVLFKNNQIERNMKPGSGRVKLFKTDIMQCTADELNFSLCLFVKEVRKPNGDEYSPDSIYYLTLGIQQYLFENGRIDNIFTDFYYEKFTECLTQILAKCQPKFNASGQMVCRIEEEHLWECKQLGAHSPYVLLNTLIYFHTKYFMLKTPEDHMKLSFAHILKYWKKGQPGKGGQPARSVSLRYYSVSTAKKDGSAPTSATKKGSKDGIPVYEVTENQDNPLRCPVKLYEFYLSKCPESIKNRSDIFYPVPERSCVPDSPVWYSTMPISVEVMTKMLTRILLVREIQEAHLHAQPIYV